MTRLVPANNASTYTPVPAHPPDELTTSAVVGAAAEGADLLVLDPMPAAADRPEVHLVLPTSREVFAQDSVEPAWRYRLAAALNKIEDQGTRATVRQTHAVWRA